MRRKLMQSQLMQSPILALALTTVAGAAVPLDTLVNTIRGEVRPQEGMEYMRRIYSTDRWFTFPKFQETAEYVKRTMLAIGLKDVEIVNVPADGCRRKVEMSYSSKVEMS